MHASVLYRSSKQRANIHVPGIKIILPNHCRNGHTMCFLHVAQYGFFFARVIVGYYYRGSCCRHSCRHGRKTLKQRRCCRLPTATISCHNSDSSIRRRRSCDDSVMMQQPRGGGCKDEDAPPAPTSPRSRACHKTQCRGYRHYIGEILVILLWMK